MQATRRAATSFVGMAIFLGGWTMTFAALLFVWADVRLTSPVWPPDGEPRAPLVHPAAATVLMALSSWALARGRTVDAATLNRGRDAYQQYCRPCHGERGDGHGYSSPGLRPPPRDFTQGIFKFGHTPIPTLPPDAELASIVRRGLNGTAMLPWD